MPPPKVVAWILNLKPEAEPFEFFDEDGTEKGLAMGVSSESMIKYREDYGIPNSDAFEPELEPLNQWDMMQLRLGRKRTGSCQKVQVLKGTHHLLRYNACKRKSMLLYVDY